MRRFGGGSMATKAVVVARFVTQLVLWFGAHNTNPCKGFRLKMRRVMMKS
jgi:hypothetical protein